VWGDLKITTGTMTVTIPQEFIDRAAYPITIDPDIGYSALGASTDWITVNHNTSLLIGTVFTPSVTGEPKTLSMYIRGMNPQITITEDPLEIHWSGDGSYQQEFSGNFGGAVGSGTITIFSDDPPGLFRPRWKRTS